MPDIEEDDDDDLPYSRRAGWSDVVPVPQDDGPEPLAVIRYPEGFQEVHSYFRAIQQRGEYSARALRLTADVIEHNSANYTAWYYRRRCLTELKSDLAVELVFTNQWSRDCPKNYQVWYHRRWLINEIAEHIKSVGADADKIAAQLAELGQTELDYHLDVMQVNDDYKNYNGWSHRQFIAQKFGLWEGEMNFVEDLLRDDVRNNSAWNHRFTVVRNMYRPMTDDAQRREIAFTLRALRNCANNESAWIYLAAFVGEGEGKAPWNSVPELEPFIQDVLAASPDPQYACRFALEAKARLHESRGEVADAIGMYGQLRIVDKIRASYWDWRADLAKTTS